MGGSTPIDAKWRPARMDTARVFAELSKTIVSLSLLGGAELTLDDAVLHEHVEYLKLVQTVAEKGAKANPSPATMDMIETSMKLRGNSVVTRMEDGFVKTSRISYVNEMKVPEKLQEYQIHHDDRLPAHTVMPEVRTIDQADAPSAAYTGDPPGMRVLQLTLQKKIYTKLGTSEGAALLDKEVSDMTLSSLIRSQDLRACTDPQAAIRLFGAGSTTVFLTQVMTLSA